MYIRVAPPTVMAWVDDPAGIALAAVADAPDEPGWGGSARHPVSAASTVTSTSAHEAAEASPLCLFPRRVPSRQVIPMRAI